MLLHLVACSLMVTARALIPDGYIMKLSYQCGADTSSDASVHIVTDLHADVSARCAGDRLVNFTTADNVHFYLDILYPGMAAKNDQCVFVKRVDAEVYTIQVTFSYGEPDNEVHNDLEVRSLTCTFDRHGNQISGTHTVNERLIAPEEVLANAGEKASSKLTLVLCTIKGHKLDPTPIHLGRKVRLDGFSDGASGEKGIRITQCDAIGSETGTRYQVLRAGCGDGVVLDKTDGFITKGLATKSPYFRMFRLERDVRITFECNFTLCKDNCDGNSCPFHRSRREVTEQLVMSTDNKESNSMFKLTRTYVGGYPADDHRLQPGRYYRLKVELAPSADVKGVRVHSCIYVSNKRADPPFSGVFLENGCGKNVLTSWQGFTSQGLSAFSDPFPGFAFRGDRDLSFQCNATLCSEQCDGHSCNNATTDVTSGKGNSGQSNENAAIPENEARIRKRSLQVSGDDITVLSSELVRSDSVVVPTDAED